MGMGVFVSLKKKTVICLCAYSVALLRIASVTDKMGI